MILDTPVLVDIDRGAKKEKIEKLEEEGPHSVSSVTKTELYTGANLREKTDFKSLRQLLSAFNEVALEQEIAEKAGELIARKRKENLSIGLNDIYIAATAIQEDKKLLTQDTEDFQQIKELEVKNWHNY